MASHLTLEYLYRGVHGGLKGPVAAEQAQIISPPPPCLTVGVCADMLCLVFSKRAAVHYDQTSLWSHLSKGHCSRSYVVCSDVTLQT